jgi:uncharacterized repeat protein (TIGR03803 family)
MRRGIRMNKSLPVLLTLLTFAIAPSLSQAQYTEKILYSFTSAADWPSSPLIFDAAGNLYGTTGYSSGAGTGEVFELSPSSGGTWTENTLYSFGLEPVNQPSGSPIFDAQGNIYGVSTWGGSANDGTVFELSPSSSGWTLTVLYSFQGGADGVMPSGSLIFDSKGNLYGTTRYGGGGTGAECYFYGGGCGTVFELSPSSTGWTEKILYAFAGTSDGAFPDNGLLKDAAGNLYGTTYQGGNTTACRSQGCGTVFRLTPSGGTWHFGLLWALQETNGYSPTSLVFDSTGSLYGVANGGGKTFCRGGCGVVFKLTRPASSGPWKQSIVHAFSGADGFTPTGLTFQPTSNVLFGTTGSGGTNHQGTVFEVSPTSSGGWEFTTLYSFNGKTDGNYPDASVIVDSLGNLYGTTQVGGTDNLGTVFELSPTSSN